MEDNTIQLDLFGEEVRHKVKSMQGLVGRDDYDEFTEKFRPKLTTDDCYTPDEAYEAVLGWLREKVDIEGANIVRPFWPGADYRAYDYGKNDIVVDNPPFSILSKIIRFYLDKGVRFFLFAPHLTIFGSDSKHMCICIPCACGVRYANGAEVSTGFVSNLFGDTLAMSAPDLRRRIIEAQERARRVTAVKLPKYEYPPEVLTASMLGCLSAHGVEYSIKRCEAVGVRSLSSQRACGKAIFGSGFLISERKAAERKVVWELNDAEREAVRALSGKDGD